MALHSGIRTLSRPSRRLLAQAALCADATVPELSRGLDLAAHSVRYGLRNLEERNIAKKLWVIDLFRLGWSRYNILFSIGLQTKSIKQKLLRTLCASKQCLYLTENGGDFDYELSILGRGSSDALEYLHNVSRTFGPVFLNKSVTSRSRIALFPRKYLAPGKPLKAEIDMCQTSESVEIDPHDEAILRLMAHDGNLSNREIAQKLGAASSSVDYRIRKLRERKVLLGAVFAVNNVHYGAQSYILALYSRGFDCKLSEAIYRFARAHPHCTHFIECFGAWDYELGIEVQNYEQLTSFREELGEKFADSINSMKVLARFKTHKYVNFPF